MECRFMNETFGSCKPWAHDNLRDNLNILNNFKLNLHSYEKIFKKYSTKTRPQLPQIKPYSVVKSRNFEKSSKKTLYKYKNRTLESNANISKTKGVISNKSVELKGTRSQSKIVKTTDDHKRGQTSLQMINKENKQVKQQKEIVTQRDHCDPNNPSEGDTKNKVCLFSFDEQSKYRRLRKRQLHKIIFGQRPKIKKRQLAVLR